MITVFDVGSYILKHIGPIDAMKLQKLVYYSQAWSLVWDGKPLFRESIEAWANGPVVRSLYQVHKGRFMIAERDIGGDAKRLGQKERETVDAVLKYYGKHTSCWLSALTHREPPWRDARRGLEPGRRGSVEIKHSAMAEYYGGLV